MSKHFVFTKTDLRYDGRVCALIKTLSLSFPKDKIYIYNLIDYDFEIDFPENVRYKRFKAISFFLPKSHFTQICKAFEFSLFSFFKLLWNKVGSVQVHHEPVILGPLLYKFINPGVLVVYDDKELYHPHQNNCPAFIFRLECLLLRKADLVVFTNEYRKRAVNFMLKLKNEQLIIENFVFNSAQEAIEPEFRNAVIHIKNNGKKIILHQGGISKERGSHVISEVIKDLPIDWCFAFIGISEKVFEEFKMGLSSECHDKIVNLGFVPYPQLNAFWGMVDATLMVYDDSTFNNKYSAPNRLYLAANRGIPVLVNKANVTLNDFVIKYQSGISIPPFSNIILFFRNYEEYRKRAVALKGQFEYENGVLFSLKEFYQKRRK